MSKSTFSPKKFKVCRRLGSGVFEQCQSQKFLLAQAKRAKAAGRTRRRRVSDYGLSLIEKQKLRSSYGLREKQFAKYVDRALSSKTKDATPALELFRQLESRLDNIIYRAGYAHTRRFARQLASHGHFLVNGVRTTVPSYQLQPGDVITIREGSKIRPVFEDLSKKLKAASTPGWLSVDEKAWTTKITGVTDTPDPFFNLQTVIEFYSK